MRYLGDGLPLSRADAWRQMALIPGHWQLRGFGLWTVEEQRSGHLMGRVGLFQPEGRPGFELGWVLGRRWWGQGYATESARAAMQHAFDRLGRTHVVSFIHPENLASVRVAERLGETLEGETELFGHPVLIYGCNRPGLILACIGRRTGHMFRRWPELLELLVSPVASRPFAPDPFFPGPHTRFEDPVNVEEEPMAKYLISFPGAAMVVPDGEWKR